MSRLRCSSAPFDSHTFPAASFQRTSVGLEALHHRARWFPREGRDERIISGIFSAGLERSKHFAATKGCFAGPGRTNLHVIREKNFTASCGLGRLPRERSIGEGALMEVHAINGWTDELLLRGRNVFRNVRETNDQLREDAYIQSVSKLRVLGVYCDHALVTRRKHARKHLYMPLSIFLPSATPL